ncbi:MAG: AgmX/PglI C-terminal domain-containing protein, partial [Deltaproteobacteria bacterium]|nr:AgmX/PglI C-terminal domain-containing protein [Deltaproteobacteria bacterium]
PKKKKPKKKKPKKKLVKKKEPKQDPTEAKAKIPKRLRQRLQKRLKQAPGGGGAKSILNALKSPVQGEGTTLKEVVSNIDAIKGGGSSSAMKIAGTLSGLPGGGVNLAKGGSTEVGTLGGTEVAGSGVGKLKGRGRGKVRGSVSSVRALAKVTGQLSREEVLQVINSKMGVIQGCYEKALTKHPTLSGKITFEWTVRTSGSVGSAREKSSTMGNAQVSQCILRVIRGMKFPKPRGGEVVIAYPFMFRSVSS